MLRNRISLRMRGSYEFGVLVNNLPGIFARCGTTIHEGRNHIKVIDVSTIGGMGLTEVVVKLFHRPNVFRRLDYTFVRKSKAERAYRNADRLRRLGFRTPENLAYVECRKHGIYQRSYYVSTYDEGVLLSKLLSDDCLPLAYDFAHFVAQMHECGIVHRDLVSAELIFGHHSWGADIVPSSNHICY